MTLAHKWTIAAVVVLAVLLGVGGYELIKEHDARILSESTQTAQKQIIDTSQKSIDQAKTEQAKIASDLKGELATIAGQRTIVVTPQQAAAVVNAIPNIAQPVQVQNVPATSSSPASQQIVIPQDDIPALQKYKLDCDESSAKLTACSLNAAKSEEIQKDTDTQLKAMTTERDSWKKTAKGGSFLTRLKDNAVKVVIIGGAAYAAGRLSK